MKGAMAVIDIKSGREATYVRSTADKFPGTFTPDGHSIVAVLSEDEVGIQASSVVGRKRERC